MEMRRGLYRKEWRHIPLWQCDVQEKVDGGAWYSVNETKLAMICSG